MTFKSSSSRPKNMDKTNTVHAVVHTTYLNRLHSSARPFRPCHARMPKLGKISMKTLLSFFRVLMHLQSIDDQVTCLALLVQRDAVLEVVYDAVRAHCDGLVDLALVTSRHCIGDNDKYKTHDANSNKREHYHRKEPVGCEQGMFLRRLKWCAKWQAAMADAWVGMHTFSA